jgi:hypothetical protein
MWLGVVVEEGQASAGAAFPWPCCCAVVAMPGRRRQLVVSSVRQLALVFLWLSVLLLLLLSFGECPVLLKNLRDAADRRSCTPVSPSRRPGCRRAAFLPQTRSVALSCRSSQCLDRRAKDGPCRPMATCYQLPSQCDPLLTRPTDHPNARLARRPLFASGRRSLFGLRPPSDDAPTRPPLRTRPLLRQGPRQPSSYLRRSRPEQAPSLLSVQAPASRSLSAPDRTHVAAPSPTCLPRRRVPDGLDRVVIAGSPSPSSSPRPSSLYLRRRPSARTSHSAPAASTF